MGHLIEISMIQDHRVFYEKNQGNGERFYFTAYVQLFGNGQFIIDDLILPRLKQRLFQVLKLAQPKS